MRSITTAEARQVTVTSDSRSLISHDVTVTAERTAWGHVAITATTAEGTTVVVTLDDYAWGSIVRGVASR